MCERLVGASRPSISTWSQSILPIPGTLQCPDPQPQACLTVQGLLVIVDLPSGLWWSHCSLQYLLPGLFPDQFVAHHALEFRLRKLTPLFLSFLFSVVSTTLFLLYVGGGEGEAREERGGRKRLKERVGGTEGEREGRRDIFLL